VSAFRKWDADHKGFICEADLRKVLKEAGVPEDQAGATFAEADTNKDGKLDYEEFVAWVFSGGDHAAKVREAAAAAGLPWPQDPSAVLSPGGSKPEKLQLAAPVPCKDEGTMYWSAGGPAKTRIRIVEDAGALKLGKEFSVAVRFRVPSGASAGGADYETLLMGHDSLHWIAVECAGRRLCCVSGKTGKSSVLDHVVPADEWATIFLQPRGEGTVVWAFDAEGLVEVGSFDLSLVGSRLDKLGWAEGVVDIAEVLLWTRPVPWREMSAVHPRPPPPAARPPSAGKPRRTFRGQVVDVASGQGLPDVKVSWPKGDCRTDEEGCFEASLSDAETEAPEEDDDGVRSSGSAMSAASSATVLSFVGEGLAPASAAARCAKAGGEASLRVSMRRISASSVMDASAGGQVVDEASGSSLTVAPDALAYPDGSPVEGSVTVSLSVIDVTDPASLASMPGDFSAVGEDGASVFLQSLGAAWIGASDEAGREVTVKEGSDGVTLDLKTKAAADSEKLGADAEMWSFNEDTGKWELLQKSLLKVDGQTAPNSAARSTLQPAASKPSRFSGGPKKKKGGWKKRADYDDEAPPELIEGCMSPEAFRKAVGTNEEKTLSTNLTKLGYINCDLAYHHPQRAVMLMGQVLGPNRQPMDGVQLWSVGRDYSGRCPDVAKDGGKFGAMIAQFDSEVDVEAHVNLPGEGDDKLSVYIEERGFPYKASAETLKLLKRLLGKYMREGGDSCMVWSKKKKGASKTSEGTDKGENKAEKVKGVSKTSDSKEQKAEEKGAADCVDASIAWCSSRRQWQTIVDGNPIFVKDVDDDSEGHPFGGAWRPVAAAFPPADMDKIVVPVFERPYVPAVQKFGPFKTGPPGEFVDVGELVISSVKPVPLS